VPTHDGEKPHVILSLTSYPPRFPHLVQQLNQIRFQSEYPDLLILNIARDDEKKLPDEVKKLKFPFSFEINICEDLGPATKLLPTLIKHPDSIIVTIDDDTKYPAQLLEELLRDSREFPEQIITIRAHRPIFENFRPIPYRNWDWQITENDNSLIMPTGCLGVLYPPNSLAAGVLDVENYEILSWTSDDLWFWTHALRVGTKIRKSTFNYQVTEDELQESGLGGQGNVAILNDLNLELLWNYYRMEEVLEIYVENHDLEFRKMSSRFELSNNKFVKSIFVESPEFLSLYTSLPPRSRLDFMRPVVKLIGEVSTMQSQQRNLKYTLRLLWKNFVRKLLAFNING